MNNQYLSNIIKPFYTGLTDIELKIADYLVQTTDNLANKTLDGLASEIGVSNSSLHKFVKKIGYEGYQDFRVSIATNQANPNIMDMNYLPAFQTIQKGDTPEIIADKVLNANVYSLTNSLEHVKPDTLERILDIIRTSKSLNFFGIGGSSITAYDSFHTFLRSKYWCNYISDMHMQVSVAHKYSKDDCVFIFSHSGLSKETIQVARRLHEAGARIILLTGNANSPICEYAEETIFVVTEESIFRTEASMSRISYLTIMDILYVNTMYMDYDENYEAIKNIRKNLSDSRHK